MSEIPFPCTAVFPTRTGVRTCYDQPTGLLLISWADGQSLSGTPEDMERRARDTLRAIAARRLAQYTAEQQPFLDSLDA